MGCWFQKQGFKPCSKCTSPPQALTVYQQHLSPVSNFCECICTVAQNPSYINFFSQQSSPLYAYAIRRRSGQMLCSSAADGFEPSGMTMTSPKNLCSSEWRRSARGGFDAPTDSKLRAHDLAAKKCLGHCMISKTQARGSIRPSTEPARKTCCLRFRCPLKALKAAKSSGWSLSVHAAGINSSCILQRFAVCVTLLGRCEGAASSSKTGCKAGQLFNTVANSFKMRTRSGAGSPCTFSPENPQGCLGKCLLRSQKLLRDLGLTANEVMW